MSTEHVYLDRLTLALIGRQCPTALIYVANERLGDYETYHAGCLNPEPGKVETFEDDEFRLAESGQCKAQSCPRALNVMIFDTLEEVLSCSP